MPCAYEPLGCDAGASRWFGKLMWFFPRPPRHPVLLRASAAEGKGTAEITPRTAGALALAALVVSAVSFVVVTTRGPQGGRDWQGDLVARVLPSVVSISVLRSDIREPAGPNALDRHRVSYGSGVVIDRSGLIVTNAHVVAGKGEVRITLQGGEEFRADVIGHDTETDIAILRAEGAPSLPAVEWGDSRQMRPGDPVLAIGNPYGFGGTVTAGIVSAVNRDVRLGPRDAFIQTDANINTGNSGGPLLNAAGEIVGINTALVPAMKDGGSIGLGFAIPSAEVRPIMTHLLKYGRTHPGWVGVSTQAVTTDLAAVFGLARAQGALVASVVAGGPAASTLEPGDVIAEIGGLQIADARQFAAALETMTVGRATTIRYRRSGHDMTANIVVASQPETDCASPRLDAGSDSADKEAELGLLLAPMIDADRARLGISPGQTGAVVQGVIPFSAAADHRIVAGSVIEMVGLHRVDGPLQARDLIDRENREGRSAMGLLVRTAEGSRWVALPLNGVRLGVGSPATNAGARETCSPAGQLPTL